ncbi:hypothetical protein [Legionella spiritensis]|uniref:IcmC (DotE) n=1 Tax=Legionella spiritensis TaxID=452 RepID=A0A0W0ZAJ2_LEGSP|nr:hypothetical protein [Legionella spiritensis]KTD66079.1 IcmC (DotE) [Legionella spiritensis]SNV44323.1 IcmC (DotE) [Legionella spiritensis]VEG90785.1 IcmC (DotE) [Legionella spiritensis]
MADGGSFTSFLTSSADILNNIASTLGPVQKLISGAAYLIGLSFAFKALYSLKVYGEARTMMASNTSIKEPATYMLVAALFIYFPTGVEIILNTTFGDANILQYAPVSSNNQSFNTLFSADSVVGRPLTIIIQTIGLAAFVRGWVLVARSASQGQPPGGTGKGLMHVFGGILAMNIVATINIINNTLYGTS